MFFVHQDQAEMGQGGEDRRACTDDDAGFTGADAMPFIESFALGQMRVQHRDLVDETGEAGFETSNGLRSQGDFRNKHEHGFLLRQRVAGRLQIDLGFS